MSHKKKWKKKSRGKQRRNNRKRTHHVPANAVDRHHCLFIGKRWEASRYGSLLRRNFIYYVPVVLHRQLHNEIVHDVPMPSEDLLRDAWLKYQEEKAVVDEYSITRALAWLYANIPDPEFRSAIQLQIDFFSR